MYYLPGETNRGWRDCLRAIKPPAHAPGKTKIFTPARMNEFQKKPGLLREEEGPG